jgi:hypothetical protein
MAARGVGTLVLTGARQGRDLAPSVTWFAVGSAGGDVDLSGLEGKNVWARDPATQERLGGTAVQSGDPVLLSARVLASEPLRRRADLLRLCGAIPAGPRIVDRDKLQPSGCDRSTAGCGDDRPCGATQSSRSWWSISIPPVAVRQVDLRGAWTDRRARPSTYKMGRARRHRRRDVRVGRGGRVVPGMGQFRCVARRRWAGDSRYAWASVRPGDAARPGHTAPR